jgi:hypothetical protein
MCNIDKKDENKTISSKKIQLNVEEETAIEYNINEKYLEFDVIADQFSTDVFQNTHKFTNQEQEWYKINRVCVLVKKKTNKNIDFCVYLMRLSKITFTFIDNDLLKVNGYIDNFEEQDNNLILLIIHCTFQPDSLEYIKVDN